MDINPSDIAITVMCLVGAGIAIFQTVRRRAEAHRQ